MTPTALTASGLAASRESLGRARRAVGRAVVAVLTVARARKPSRRAVAKALVFAGGLVTAVGVALVYLPAGVILAGPCLIAWALVIFDVEGPGARR